MLDDPGFVDIFHEEIEKYSLRSVEEIGGVQFDLPSKSPQVLEEYEKLIQVSESMKHPQPRDLKLLASCRAYCNNFLPEGVLFIVTEDRELKKFTESTKNAVRNLRVLSADDLEAFIK
jgi:hypothetical protein